jgi:epsilon-lactone hydrolase
MTGKPALEVSRRGLLIGVMATIPGSLTADFAAAAAADSATREVPARLLPVPDTISPELAKFVGAPLSPGWDTIPADAAAWKQLAADSVAAAASDIAAIKAKMGIAVEQKTIAGVPVFVTTPTDMPERNRNRVLLHLHGGGYVLFPGEAGAVAPDFPSPPPSTMRSRCGRRWLRKPIPSAWRCSAPQPAAGSHFP